MAASRNPSATSAPAWARATAAARPRPRAAPVTSATWFVSVKAGKSGMCYSGYCMSRYASFCGRVNGSRPRCSCLRGAPVCHRGRHRPTARRPDGHFRGAADDPWPTYNGDYSGRRFSPLTNDQRRKTSARSALPGSTARTPAADARRRRRSRARRCRSTACCTSACPITCGRSTRARAARSWHYVWPTHGRQSPRQPRRRGARRLAVLRNARLPSRLAEHARTAPSAGTRRSAISSCSTTARRRR